MLEIFIWPKLVPLIYLYYDCEATLLRAYNKSYNGKSRHIALRHNYVRQLLQDGVVNIDFVRSSENLADPLTKSLTREVVWKTSRGMRLKPT